MTVIVDSSGLLPVVVIGHGGHGKVVTSALRASGRIVIGATVLRPDYVRLDRQRQQVNGFRLMTDEMLVSEYEPQQVDLALGIGSVDCCDANSARVEAVARLTSYGYRFVGFRHPSAWVDPEATIDCTVQVHAGVVVQPGCVIGAHTILNTGSTVDHDCEIGNFCHVAPGAVLSGAVKVGCGSHLGTGCQVIQAISIGQLCFVAAGATVVRSVDDGTSVRGTPAKPFELRK